MLVRAESGQLKRMSLVSIDGSELESLEVSPLELSKHIKDLDLDGALRQQTRPAPPTTHVSAQSREQLLEDSDFAWDYLVPRDDSRIITVDEILPRVRTSPLDPSMLRGAFTRKRKKLKHKHRAAAAPLKVAEESDSEAEKKSPPRLTLQQTREAEAGPAKEPTPEEPVKQEVLRSPVPETDAGRKDIMRQVHKRPNFIGLETSPTGAVSPTRREPASPQEKTPTQAQAQTSSKPSRQRHQQAPAAESQPLPTSPRTPSTEKAALATGATDSSPRTLASLDKLVDRVGRMKASQFRRLERKLEAVIDHMANK